MSKEIDKQVDGARRQALKKLGLGMTAVYTAPALLMLSGCHAYYPYRHSHGSHPSYSRPSD